MALCSWLVVLFIGFACCVNSESVVEGSKSFKALDQKVKVTTEEHTKIGKIGGDVVDVESQTDAEAIGANAAVAAIAALSNAGGDLRSKEEIHPFRVRKHAPAMMEEQEQQKSKQQTEQGAGWNPAPPAPAAITETYSLQEKKQPELMRYFDRQHTESRNPTRRQQQQKMAVGAQKRLMRQEQEGPQITPAAPVQSYPHLAAFLQEQLAEQAQEALESKQTLLLDQSASTAPAAVAASTPAAATVTGVSPAPSTAPAGVTPTVSTTQAVVKTTATGGASQSTTTPAGSASAIEPTASSAAVAVVSATGGTAVNTAAVLAESSSTGSSPVVDSVVPLSHLQQLQQELSSVEAEHAARQAELASELAAQQAQTKTLLDQQKQGTVGLTVTPTLIDPVGAPPLDPSNAPLYNNAPTNPAMNIRPSVLNAANNLISKEQAQHAEFVVNMPIECAEPTCTVDSR